MRLRPSAAAFLALCVSLCAAPSAATASWLQTVDIPAGRADSAFAVTVDSAGDVYSGGRAHNSTAFHSTLVVVKSDGATGEELWRYEIPGGGNFGEATALVADATSVYVTGRTTTAFVMARLDGATGSELWREDGPVVGGAGFDIALDGAGGVVAVGHLAFPSLAVIKRDAATGAEEWITEFPLDSASFDMSVDVASNGDVFAAGRARLPAPDPDFSLVRLDGGTGVEIWQYNGFVRALDMAVTSSDDVVLVGRPSSTGGFSVRKVDGATGAEDWGTDLAPTGGVVTSGNSIALDAAGDVLVGGEELLPTERDAVVAKLSGATGAVLWRTSIGSADPDSRDTVESIVLDGAGSVYAAGASREKAKFPNQVDFLMAKLDAATGDLLWKHQLDGANARDDFARSVAVGADGNPVAGGEMSNEHSAADYTVAKLDADDGALATLFGRSLSFRDPGLEIQRKLNFVVKDPAIRVPASGSIHDPRTAGATLRIFNPTSLEEATFFLPPGPAWKGLGNPQGSKGYKYRANGAGACSAVTVVPGKTMKAVCRGVHGSLPFDLDEPTQGSLQVSIDFGGSIPLCARFGGTVSKDEPGRFKGKVAPRPIGCL